MDLRGGARVSSGTLPEWAEAIGTNQGKVWVAHARGTALSVVDERTLSVSAAQVPGASLWAIAACCDFVHVGGRLERNNARGIVASVDPITLLERERRLVGERIAVMTDDFRHVAAVGER
jgi:hypothetical protein